MKHNSLKKVKKFSAIKSIIFLIVIFLFIFLYFNINNKSKNINNNKHNLKISDYDNIYMPDQNLKNELLKLLKDKAYRDEQRVELTNPYYVKSSYETEITKREAEMFKIIGRYLIGEDASQARFPLTNKQIKDLTGLEYFINLTGLRLQNNLIENLLPIKNLNKLGLLDIEYNKIKDITPLTELTNLSYLFLNNNQIKEISSLSKMTKMKKLHIDNNQITDISPLLGLINLEYLSIYNNQIKEIKSLSKMTRMRDLRLQNNQITDISPLSGLINLELLAAGDNQIKEINSLSKMTKMKILDIYNNQIIDISALSGLINLEGLSATDNQIKEINSLSKMTKMRNLLLQNNRITDISALLGLINLEYLSVGDNQIKEISSLSKMRRMRELRIYNNQITDISALSGLINLEYLSIYNNQIKEISILSKMRRMRELRIYNNQITDISALSGLINLEVLSISKNQITDISALKNKNKIKKIWIYENKISDFSPLQGIINNFQVKSLGNQKLEYRPTEKELDIILKDENGNNIIIPDSEYLKRKPNGKYEILKEPAGEYIELKASPNWNGDGYIRIYTDKLNFYTPQIEKMYVRKANSNFSYLGDNLEYNSAIKNLPSGAKVTVLKDIDKNVLGNQKANVKITLADGKENIVDIDVEVLDNLSFNIFLKDKDGKGLNILEELKAEYKTKNILSKDKNVSGKYSGVIFENGTYKLTFDGNRVPKGYKGLNEYTLTYEGNPNIGEKLILKLGDTVISEKTISKGGKNTSSNDFDIILEKILELPKAGSKENLKIYTIVAMNLMLAMLAFKKRRNIYLFFEKRFMR